MKLELYYKEAVEGVVGRKERYVSLPPYTLTNCVAEGQGNLPAESSAYTRRTTLEKQLAADALTPDTLKARQLLALGRRESK